LLLTGEASSWQQGHCHVLLPLLVLLVEVGLDMMMVRS
jgi:hypothetical protein